MKNKRRVVITGIGVVTSIGIGKDAFWQNALEGKSGISEVTSIDTSRFRCHKAGEVKDFNPADFIARRKIKFLGRSSQLAIGASYLALQDANLPLRKIPRLEMGVILGTTTGERPLEELVSTWVKGGR